MRSKALDMLHESHQGLVKTKQFARDLIYFPGLNKQVEDVVSKCSFCQERRPAQTAEPLIPMQIPDRPWQHVAEDLLELDGEKWLICVDYFSNYFEMEQLQSADGDTPYDKQRSGLVHMEFQRNSQVIMDLLLMDMNGRSSQGSMDLHM